MFIDESNNLRVKKGTQVAISNRLDAAGSFSTVPDKYTCTVCNKDYKKQLNLEKTQCCLWEREEVSSFPNCM